MNKFNESVQIEETTAFQENQAMEEFQLTAPKGWNNDDDSIGELSTQDGIIIKENQNG